MELKNNHDISLLLERMLAGTLDESGKDDLRAYIESTFRDEKLNDLMNRHWNSLNRQYVKQDEQELEDLKRRIRTMVMHDQVDLVRPVQKGMVRLMKYLVRAAAILTIPLLIFSGYLYSRLSRQAPGLAGHPVMQQVIATPGSRVRFVLPDQSEVWLNSGSSLEFPNSLDNQKLRRVKLLGQGYFRVSKDEKHPFIVETGELNVKVLGTSFDVSCYTGDQFVRSTLEEGAIALLNSQGCEVAFLKPGQQAVYNRETKKLTVNQVDTRLTTSWKDGTLMFRDSPLEDVTIQLERWFNCTIHVDPELINSGILYTATIKDETLGEVLQMIEISTQVKTKIKNREVTIWSE